MHRFTELIERCTRFTLNALNDAEERTFEGLQTSGATSLVKALQAVGLQKVILAVGMFSIFEAVLQGGLRCEDGFRAAADLLDRSGKAELKEKFITFQQAINVLKHGYGRSYEALVAKAETLEFRIKLPDEGLFEEGDVSEIWTLVQVDDKFVLNCASVIYEVSEVIREADPQFVF